MGKTVTTNAIVGDAYGKPSNTKVTWSYRVGIFEVDEKGSVSKEIVKYFNAKETNDIVNNIKAFTFSKGKLKVGGKAKLAKAREYLPYDNQLFGFEVIAKTADGTNYSESKSYIIYDRGNGSELYLGFLEGEKFFRYSTVLYYDDDINNGFGMAIYTDAYPSFEVTSSDSKVVSAFSEGRTLWIVPHDKGTAKIKVKALDGSGLTATVTLKYVKTKAK